MTVQGKTLAVTTYSQCNWDSLDNLDSGFTYTSATEIATKMYSRQCILINGAGFSNTTTDFNVTDAPQFCSQVRILAVFALIGKKQSVCSEISALQCLNSIFSNI